MVDFSSNIKLKRRLRQVTFWVISLILICLAVSAIPKRLVTIGVGPAGGAYYEAGLKYKEFLEKKGYRVVLRPIDNTEEIVHRVDDAKSDIDAGFSAQDLRGENLTNTVSLGEVQTQPIFVFSRRSAYPQGVHSFSDLRGMNLVLPPEHSVTSRAVMEIFKLFHIDQQNTHISFLPLSEGVAQLKQEHFDTGLFMLSPDNEYIANLAKMPNLSLDSLGEIESIAKKFPFLRKATLPAGIYDLDKNIPAANTTLIAANVSLVAKQDIAPATAYALMEAMLDTHRQGSYVNEPGEFPSFVETDLPLHPLVADFHRTGTPWIFANLPIALASIVNKYMVAFLAFWVLAGLRHEVDEVTGLRRFLFELVFKNTLRRIRRTLQNGKPMTERDTWIVSKISAWADREEERNSVKNLLAHIKTLSSAMPDAKDAGSKNVAAHTEQGKDGEIGHAV